MIRIIFIYLSFCLIMPSSNSKKTLISILAGSVSDKEVYEKAKKVLTSTGGISLPKGMTARSLILRAIWNLLRRGTMRSTSLEKEST